MYEHEAEHAEEIEHLIEAAQQKTEAK
jgi:hypothetical protein